MPLSPSPATTLLLVRHAQTQWNAEQRYSGHTEVPLAPQAEAQIAAITQLLLKEHPVALYASPLSRCIHTALPCAQSLDIGVTVELGLRERGLGTWEGMRAVDIPDGKGLPYPLAAYSLDDAEAGLETWKHFNLRTTSTLTRIGERHGGQTVAVVTHAGVIFDLLRHNLGQAKPEWPVNGSITKILYRDGEFFLPNK